MDVGCLSKLLKLIQTCLFNCFAGHPVSVFWMFVHPWFMIHESNCNVVRQFLVISGMSLSHQHLDSAWHFEDPAACEATLREILTARWTNRSIFVCSKCTPNGVRHHVTMFHVHPWSSRFMWTCTWGHLMNYNADIADLCVSQLQEFKSSSIDMPRWVSTPRLHIDVTWGTSGFVECKSSCGLHFKMCYFLPNCTRMYNVQQCL